MNNFNLLISFPRYNEINAMAETWFTLLICGDEYPIISNLEYLGLITALTSINHRKVIQRIKKILSEDTNFFQYILKIRPIDFVCQTDVKVIKELVEKKYRDYIKERENFKIELKRRKHELIERESFIDTIATNINNPVDLDNPDKIIRIEVLGNVSGISFFRPDEVIKPLKPKN
ncbi:MAG: hypothetical protein GF383_06820 [Candidatus Lokiarchaeota archaeon]|nr:hypothetical protein [Candidatus Lokiarchaeota archaeon]MBD3339834.1 hypothetical protein [Candidatus Lokiarchaeota archaeon]